MLRFFFKRELYVLMFGEVTRWHLSECQIGVRPDSGQPEVIPRPCVCDSAFTPVTCHAHSADKSNVKTWNPCCLSVLSPSNIAGMSFLQRRRGLKKRINRGIKRLVGCVTALCGECMLCFSSAWRRISFQTRLQAVIYNIGYGPKQYTPWMWRDIKLHLKNRHYQITYIFSWWLRPNPGLITFCCPQYTCS